MDVVKVDSFLQQHKGSLDEQRVRQLMAEAREGQQRLAEFERQYVQQAIANGRIYNELRSLFPPRSHWKAWVAGNVGVSVRTVERQRKLADLADVHPALFEHWPDGTAIGVLYLIASSKAPAGTIRRLLRQAQAGNLTKKEAQAALAKTRREAKLESQDPKAHALYEAGRVGLNDALGMADAVTAFPQAVRELAYTYGVTDSALYPPLATLHQYHREAFGEIVASGHVWSSALEKDVPLAQAGEVDLRLLIREQESEQFMRFLENTRSSADHAEHQASARFVVNLRGKPRQIADQISGLGDGEYFVVVYSALDGD